MKSCSCLRALFVLLFVTTLFAAPGWAAPAPGAQEQEFERAAAAAQKVSVRGPKELPLAGQAVLNLPAGYVYLPPKEAGQLLHAMGNRPGANLQGMILPGDKQPDSDWFVVLRWEPAGYIKDDDARDWDAETMLESLKEGTEEANRERAARGIRQMEITGWVEKPTYAAPEHQLVWSVSSRDKGAAAGVGQGINYNTFALGREGFFSMNLVTDLKAIERQKAVAKELLASLQFNEGRRYTDFNSSTDKVATYGLATLVGVAAAKKLGLLAMAGVFLAKFWKIIAVAAIGFGAVWRKRSGRNKVPDAPPPAA